MTLLSATIVIKADGVDRKILTLVENRKGDVYIRLRSGLQVGLPPNNNPILQHKYSLHVSPRSPNYSTIKKTLKLADESEIVNSQLTDAAKRRSGFCPVFTIRYSDLKNEIYNLSGDEPNIVHMGEYNSLENTLIGALLVGNIRKYFPSSDAKYRIAQMQTKNFKIIFLAGLTQTPSTPFSGVRVGPRSYSVLTEASQHQPD